MLRLSIILLFVCSYAFSQSNNTTGSIADGEGGASVRATLNDDLQKGNAQHDSLVVHRTELLQHYDSLAIHRTELLQQYDSLGIHRTELLQHYDSLGIHRTEITANLDSLAIHRAEIDANLDSLAAHRTEIDANLDSIGVHRVELLQHYDSLAVHRVELLQHYDSLAVHRTELLQQYDSLGIHRTELLQQYDSLAVHRTELLQHYDSINNHRDTLTDHNTRIVALEVAGGSSIGDSVTLIWAAVFTDTISFDSVVHMLGDTLHFPYGWGDGLDSTGMDIGVYLGTFDQVQDSLVTDSLRYRLLGTGGDLSFTLYYGEWGTAGTALTAEIDIATTDGWLSTTTFTELALAPGQSVWAKITDKSYAGTAIRIYFYFREKRAP